MSVQIASFKTSAYPLFIPFSLREQVIGKLSALVRLSTLSLKAFPHSLCHFCLVFCSLGPSEYHLKDVSIPSFSPEEFSESSRWEQITKLEGLYSADSPTRWTLHERVKRESTRLSEKAAKKSKKQRDKDLYFWVRRGTENTRNNGGI